MDQLKRKELLSSKELEEQIESLKLDLKVKQAHVDDLEDDLLTSQKEI